MALEDMMVQMFLMIILNHYKVISDISSNSNPLSSYDSVLKCINSKPTISSNERIEDVIKGVLKKVGRTLL